MSLWEIAIKIKISKLNIRNSIQDIVSKCHEDNIKVIPIKTAHLDKTLELPMDSDHKDPFDRLIVSTAIIEGLTLISTDTKMKRYEVDVID